jgi:hypothetical protein
MFRKMFMLKIIKLHSAIRIVAIEIFFTVFFALLYWISDLFLNKYPETGKKFGLGSIEQVDTFYSYFYFSLITQTTVGFGGILPEGGNVVTTKSNLLQFFTVMQLLSIICTPILLLI